MVVKLSYSFIPLQEVSQKGVDRSVENPQKRTENTKITPPSPPNFPGGMPLCFSTHDSLLEESDVTAEIIPYMALKKNEIFLCYACLRFFVLHALDRLIKHVTSVTHFIRLEAIYLDLTNRKS